MRQDGGRNNKKPGSRRIIRSGTQRTAGLLERHGNTIIVATIISAVIAVLLRVRFISPLLFTAAVFPFFYTALRSNDNRWSLVLTFRWAITLFLTLLVIGVFVPGRLGASLPFAGGTVTAFDIWLRDSSAPPPADLGYLLWGMSVFLVGSVVSGGLVGLLVGSVALGGAAYVALHIFRHGLNILQIALVAVPLWQVSLFVAGAFLLVPMSAFTFERLYRIERRYEEREMLRHFMYVGAGLFVLSILFRYATASLWHTLLGKWTVL